MESHAQGPSDPRENLSEPPGGARRRGRVRGVVQQDLASREDRLSNTDRGTRGAQATPGGVAQTCVQGTGCATRIVVFDLGGTIDWTTCGAPILQDSYITIAGQTAPGGGITVKLNRPLEIGPDEAEFEVSNIVIRYLRFRHVGTPSNQDVISIRGPNTHTSVMDHISASWGTDEVMSSVYGSHDITFSYNLIAEGESDELGGRAGMGSLFSSGARRMSIHHNLWTDCGERMPKMKGREDYATNEAKIFDFVNNLVYHWGGYGTACAGNANCNIVANFFRKGPSSPDTGPIVRMQNDEPGQKRALFVTGNYDEIYCPTGCADDWRGGLVTDIYGDGRFTDNTRVDTRFPAPALTTDNPLVARDKILESAGASRALNCDGSSYSRRDPIDTRLISEVINRSGTLGPQRSFPTLASGSKCLDSDNDGMPNAFESVHGTNPNSDDASGDKNGNGYTNIEEYLNGVDGNGVDGSAPFPPRNLRKLI